MILVAIMACTIIVIGRLISMPKRIRRNLLYALLFVVVIIQLSLPMEHPLKEATGRDIRIWALLGAGVALILVYRIFLTAMRKRAQNNDPDATLKPSTNTHPVPLSHDELNRYSRHILLKELGGTGQLCLKRSKVLVIGAGGLGSSALQYLASSGVGDLTITDDDQVELSNLQRQVIHTHAQIGENKAQSAHIMIKAQNPFITATPITQRLTQSNALELIKEHDLILDASDNYETRRLINQTCLTAQRPLVFAALSSWEGQISCVNPSQNTACYSCLFPTAPKNEDTQSCATAGVFSPLAGVMGTLMASEGVKILTGSGEPLYNRLMIFDALHAQTQTLKTQPNSACPDCSHLKLHT